MTKSSLYSEAPLDGNEKLRLKSLKALKILDTPFEERFDRITKLALDLFDVPISTITLIDSEREWFKSCQGLDAKEGQKAISFCSHALLSENMMVVPDTKRDPRFARNPMVLGKPYIRFYAGVPLRAADGQRVGVFCVKDRRPRTFSERKKELLRVLASWSELELNVHELGRALWARERAEKEILDLLDVLQVINKILRHDIVNDLMGIKMGLKLYLSGKANKRLFENALRSIEHSLEVIERTKGVESAVLTGDSLKPYSVRKVIGEVLKNFPSVGFELQGRGAVLADEAFASVIENIVKNSVEHGKTDKVNIKIRKENGFTVIKIADFGRGIPSKEKERIFGKRIAWSNAGKGLGMFIIRKTIQRYGGEVKVGVNKPKGTVFSLFLRPA